MYRPTFKYLSGEGKRNRHNADLFQALLCKAWGDCSVMTGHHVAFLFDGELDTEDEIPSADCLLFDLDIMEAVFGFYVSRELLQELACLPRGYREDRVRELYRKHFPNDGLAEHPMDYSAAAA